MPQFDTFSFLSQLFWVFLTFGFFFFFLSYYLLPALSVILKVRKSKLSPVILTSENATTLPFNCPLTNFLGYFFSAPANSLSKPLANFAKNASCNDSFQGSMRLFSAKALEKALKTLCFAVLRRGLKKPKL
jgi:hypothetical protein